VVADGRLQNVTPQAGRDHLAFSLEQS
jgi:hypothetical protein